MYNFSKQFYMPILLIFMGLFLSSCQSNEEKAEALIRADLNKVINNFDSYEPIETLVTEENFSIHNSPNSMDIAMLAVKAKRISDEYQMRFEDAQKKEDYWDYPYSEYAKEQYSKYKEESANMAVAKFQALIKYSQYYNQLIANRDSLMYQQPDLLGWNVKHTFRMKDDYGNSIIKKIYYLIDKDFEKVRRRIDMDSREYQILESVENAVPDSAGTYLIPFVHENWLDTGL